MARSTEISISQTSLAALLRKQKGELFTEHPIPSCAASANVMLNAAKHLKETLRSAQGDG